MDRTSEIMDVAEVLEAPPEAHAADAVTQEPAGPKRRQPGGRPSMGQGDLLEVTGALKESERFRKAAELIHSYPLSGSLSRRQQLVLNILLRNAASTQPDEDGFWTIPHAVLRDHYGFGANTWAWIQAAEGLASFIFVYDALKDGERGIGTAALFPNCEYFPQSGVVRYKVNEAIRPIVLDPEQWASIDLQVLARFKKAASIKLYELMARFRGIHRTPFIEKESLLNLLCGGHGTTRPGAKKRKTGAGSSYEDARTLVYNVLRPAITEINKVSDLEVDLEANSKRKATAFRFHIRPKRTAQDHFFETVDGKVLAQDVCTLGVSFEECKSLLQQYGSEALTAAARYTEAQASRPDGKIIRNKPAYLRHTLKHGYAAPATAGWSMDTLDGSAAAAKPLPAPALSAEDMIQLQMRVEARALLSSIGAEQKRAMIESHNDTAMPALRMDDAQRPAAVASFERWVYLNRIGVPDSNGQLNLLKSYIASH